MNLKPRRVEGAGPAYVGLAVGIVLSVAGNVAHAYVPPGLPPRAPAPSGWEPAAGVVVSSTFWPIILFLTLEIMLSVRWPRRWYLQAVRWGALGVVAGIAAVVSYQHLSGLLRYWGESEFAWRFGPGAVDGLLVMSTTAVVVLRLRLTSAAGADETPTAPGPLVATLADVERRHGGEFAVDGAADELAAARRQLAAETTFDGRPVAVPAANGARQPGGNAKLVLDALPGTVADLARRTGVKRTTVDYALKKTLEGQVRQDGDVWRPTT